MDAGLEVTVIKICSVMWQFGTSLFNKVVRWHRLGEVEDVKVAYNFSHFVSFYQNLLKLVEI